MARKKNIKLKEPVRIRFKELANGSKSIYLDIYNNGQRSYKFLKLYLLPEINANIREQNRTTMAAAEKIKSQYIIELTENKAGLRHTSKRAKMLFSEWIDTYIKKRSDAGMRGMRVYETIKRIIRLYRPKALLGDIDKEFCLGLIRFLSSEYKTSKDKPLSLRTQSNYMCYFSTVLNAAVREEVIPENPVMKISENDKVKVPDSMREFLTIEELRLLIATECRNELVKRAYLFACYCGLRFSDVIRLCWGDIVQDGDRWRVGIRMKKTGSIHYFTLSHQAREWLPERNDDKMESQPFAGLPAENNVNRHLRKWTAQAGIKKHITFHTSRHTFATLLLTLDVDLYTTSKMLGHRNVKTTQIYAKIIDKKKEAAVDRIDEIFG